MSGGGRQAVMQPKSSLDLSVEPLMTEGPLAVGSEAHGFQIQGGWVGELPPGSAAHVGVAGVQEVELGRVIDGRFRVDALLGQGAVGRVYRCRHLVLDKDVAIKVLRPDYAGNAEIAGRLEVEAKAASAVGSPHIVETVDFGRLPDGSAYFVMEYLEGRSLGQLLELGGGLSAGEVLHIAVQIAEALDAAHSAGIVHRDLKPDNVFLVRCGGDTQFVKILDFGIAKLTRAESKLTRAGHIYGTPHYMSPEQAEGRPVDLRTDVYSLGILLYEMVTSKVPFDADEPMAVLRQHIHDPPPALVPAAGGDFVPRIEAVICKCLQKDPEGRYGSMAELAADLERLGAGALPDAARASRVRTEPPAGGPSALRSARGAYTVAAVAIVASASLGYAFYARGTDTSAASVAPAAPQMNASGAAPVDAAQAPAEPEQAPGKPVVLIVLPADARITQDGKDLGAMPVTLRVPEGGQTEVLLERSGYISRRLVLKGDLPRVVIGLVEEGITDADAEARAQAAAEQEAAEQETVESASAAQSETPEAPEKPPPAASAEPAAPAPVDSEPTAPEPTAPEPVDSESAVPTAPEPEPAPVEPEATEPEVSEPAPSALPEPERPSASDE